MSLGAWVTLLGLTLFVGGWATERLGHHWYGPRHHWKFNTWYGMGTGIWFSLHLTLFVVLLVMWFLRLVGAL